MQRRADEIRQILIDGTIHVIATVGLDGATTKQIGTQTGMNEAYIYRHFNGKEDLFAKTFAKLDNELISTIIKSIPVMEQSEVDIETRCWIFFTNIWKFLLGNSEKCICYMQYFYSPYFKKYSYDEHVKNYDILVEKFAPAFKKDADVWLLLNHLLDMMLASAMKVFHEVMPNNEKTAKYVFDLLYSSVESHLSWTRKHT